MYELLDSELYIIKNNTEEKTYIREKYHRVKLDLDLNVAYDNNLITIKGKRESRNFFFEHKGFYI